MYINVHMISLIKVQHSSDDTTSYTRLVHRQYIIKSQRSDVTEVT